MSASTRKRSENVSHLDYRPLGAVREAWLSRDPELVCSGPAGTGKTRGLLELIHLLALKYPGSRGLICRKARKALTQTALVTFDKEVRPHLDGVLWRTGEQEYRYPNGSVVVVGGLDKEGQKLFSGQYDHVYVNEATELSEPEWENLTTRLRNGRSPRQRLFGDCNPDRPTHWLRVRSQSGRCRMLESRHEDNPRLYDQKARVWTAEGEAYIGRLDALTGPRKARLRHGRWAGAEGLVYEDYDPALHVIDPFEIPPSWPRVWAVDFGYTNPFACLMAAVDGDGRLYVYRQVYHTKRLVSEHAARLKKLSADEPAPHAIVADPEDREGRETLAAHGFGTVAAVKHGGAMEAGIQAVAARFKRAGDGKPRLFIFRDSLDERDPDLDAARRPTCLQEELDGYVWDKGGRDRPAANQDDHAADAARYLIFALDAPREADDEDETVTVCVA